MVVGYTDRTTDEEMTTEKCTFDRYFYPEFYDCYNVDEIPDYMLNYVSASSTNSNNLERKEIIKPEETTQPLDSPMDSPWPMYCHDVSHTGRSPFNTMGTSETEKWRLKLQGLVWGSPIIDNDGIIYVGAWDFYAIYPNGTIKWQKDISAFSSAAAIDEDGIIYVGTIWAMPNYLYAIYSNNGTIKWKYYTGDDVYSSPVVGDDGAIYFGDANNNINALYPNGTLRWRFTTNHVVYSSPAIGEDGTVYCGSHDSNLYALCPNNGTLKWKFDTGGWIRTSPCIADDGTIHVVSLDNYLYAVYPNGTLKWKTDVGAGTSPTIGHDGTIYAGYTELHAVNPTNGSVKWTFDVDGKIRGATACNSIDGIIYLGNSEGSNIIAVNPDGTEKWRKSIGGDVESAPAIGENGTVYIGDGEDDGYLHAFGELDPDAPTAPDIDGPTSGKAGSEYEYTFKSTSPLSNDLYYRIEWDDGTTEEWIGPYESGEEVTTSHTWSVRGTYTIQARAKDTENLWGPWGELEVTMPKNKIATNSLLLKLLETFPNAFPILRNLLGL